MKNRIQKYGLLAALGVVFYLLILYFINKELLTRSALAYWFPFVLYAMVMFKASAEDCAEKGLNRDFRGILRTPFAVFALANVVFWLTLYGLHLADPELTRIELTKQVTYAKTELEKGLGDPQAMFQKRQEIIEIEKELNTTSRQPLGPYIFYLAIWNILGFALAALVAVWQRSKR